MTRASVERQVVPTRYSFLQSMLCVAFSDDKKQETPIGKQADIILEKKEEINVTDENATKDEGNQVVSSEPKEEENKVAENEPKPVDKTETPSKTFTTALLPSQTDEKLVSGNAFVSGSNMNGGCVMTGRPSSRVLAPPGGHTSFKLG
jgi:hypothetical protein